MLQLQICEIKWNWKKDFFYSKNIYETWLDYVALTFTKLWDSKIHSHFHDAHAILYTSFDEKPR